jgi:amino acid adenylation domain-containing protein/non-ribosomal peptide synthase protein (TIGR01720 family)
MNVTQILNELARLEIKLSVEAGQLRVRAPKGAMSDELREGLSCNKAALIALLREMQAVQEGVTIPRLERPDGYALLSFSQQRLWFLDQLHGQSGAYHIAGAMRLDGRLDCPALFRGLREVVRRHESLRTTFVTVDETARQRIAAEPSLSTEIESLKATSEAEVAARIVQEIGKPFDLAKGPLFRAKLFSINPVECVLVLVMHHIIADGWSLGIFVRELAAHYEAFVAGREPSLPALPIQFADYAEWQRKWLRDERLERNLDYWKRQLSGSPAVLEMPADRRRPPVQSNRGSTCELRFEPELLRGINLLCDEESASLFMGLFAVFAVLIYRLTACTDLVIGTPISNRSRWETEPIIGCFANTVALRVNLKGRPTVREVLKRVREVALGAYEHQEIPFEQVVEALQPERSLGHTPIFQVVFALQSSRIPQLNLPGVTVTPIFVDPSTAKFDLTFQAAETDEGLRIEIEYNTDLFDAERIERLAARYAQLLASVTEDPEQRVEQIAVLPREERELIRRWGEGPGSGDDCESIPAIFERHAASSPDSIAVVFQNERVTYSELNKRSNRLARLLAQREVRKGMLVGVSLPRTVELIVALLAVLKSGAGYLPLDGDYPEERLQRLLADAGVHLVIADGESGPALKAADVLLIDDDKLKEFSDSNPGMEISPEDLAYVMYTSGSTGVPKGVAVPHRGVTRLVSPRQEYLRFSKEEVFLQLAPVSFDASTLEIWGPLLNGGRLVLMPPGMPTLEEMGRVIQSEEVTTLWLTAGLFHLAVDECIEQLRPVRQLLAGGDVLSPARVRRVQRELPGCVLCNGYGPTENTTFTCCHRLESNDPISGSVPIGRPIGKTRVYVLDKNLERVGIGIPGELYTDGDGLAWGYWNCPDLTAEKFLPNPFGDVPGARIYRTGDLVRFGANGVLEFLGRIDRQVKIRGFRVELAGIEAVLSAHPSIREAAVVKRPGGADMLVAYVVAAPDLELDQLHDYLKSHLPGYMIPACVVALDTIPLTPNGKLDRAALPDPPPAAAAQSAGFEAPRSTTEALLAEVWSQLLGAKRVGVFDNFFALGGDSIISIQVVARANQRGLKLTSKDIFENQTIAELARVVRSAETGVQQELVSGAVPLTPIQRWFLDQHWLEPHHFNQSVLLEVKCDASQNAIQSVLREMIIHHDQLRAIFRNSGGLFEQVVLAEGREICIETFVLDLLEEPLAAREIIARLQAEFDLEDGPLLKAALFRSPARRWLFLAIHHLVVDGVSWRILLGDLQTGLEQALRGERPRFPAKTCSFQEWAMQLNELSRTPKFLAQTAGHPRWLVIDEAIPLDFETDPAANDVQSAETVSESLEQGETKALLRDLPRLYNVEINHALLFALSEALHIWTGRERHWVDLEAHGRDAVPDLDTSRTVGWMTALFPFQLVFDPRATIEERTCAIRRELQAQPLSGAAYGILRYLAKDRTDNLASPSPKISFNYLGQVDGVLPDDSLFRFSKLRFGSDWSPSGRRSHWIAVNCIVDDGVLVCYWEYSRNLQKRETIEKLASEFTSCLRKLIRTLGEPRSRSVAVTFPDIQLTEEEFCELQRLASM